MIDVGALIGPQYRNAITVFFEPSDQVPRKTRRFEALIKFQSGQFKGRWRLINDLKSLAQEESHFFYVLLSYIDKAESTFTHWKLIISLPGMPGRRVFVPCPLHTDDRGSFEFVFGEDASGKESREDVLKHEPGLSFLRSRSKI